MKKFLALIILASVCVLAFGSVSSYMIADANGIDTDVFLSTPIILFQDASINAIVSIKRIGLEFAVITPLLMRGITVNLGLTESFELMIEENVFTPGFGVGFSLRF